MQVRAVILAAALVLAPSSLWAADLVVWWPKGFYAQEDRALKELVAAFEQKTGKQVELVQLLQDDLVPRTQAALDAGRPPDVLYAMGYGAPDRWARDDQLAELSDAVGAQSGLFDADILDFSRLYNATTGERALYALPLGRGMNHLHVWRSLLRDVGLTLTDIPKEWEPFWAFWCEKVQPLVRKATGRDDIWAVALPMSRRATDTGGVLRQFMNAYGAAGLNPGKEISTEDPALRMRVVRALEAYTSIYRKGCTPPDAVSWDDTGNNKAFLAQRVVMTTNPTLSIPNALKATRPEDYYRHTATIEWPTGADGGPLVIGQIMQRAVVFKNAAHLELAQDFIRFLVRDGWLTHYLEAARQRMLPAMRVLLDQPFWLDPGDPHLMASAMQALIQPLDYAYAAASAEWKDIWGQAVSRVVVDGLSPEQAVDEATVRIKQIASE
jgi:multiple sugar transport system substrate-binding protein